MRSFPKTFLIAAWFCPAIVAQTGTVTPSIAILEVDRQIAREFKSGELHAYEVRLSAGEAARVLVEQRGVDVIATVFKPDGTKVKSVDSPNGANGPEILLFVAADTGTYRVEVTSFDTVGGIGRYDIKLDGVLTAEHFRRLNAAERKAFTDIPRAITALDEQRMRQNEIVMGLRQAGVKYEGRRAVVLVDERLLTKQELVEFGTLVNIGVDNVERYLGIKFDDKYYDEKRLYYFVSDEVRYSYYSGRESRRPYIFLEGPRVKAKTDPYLHETAHAILGETGSAWLAEGLANYVSSYVSEHGGGYDHKVFGNRSNRGVDQHVRELLAKNNNTAKLQKILAELDHFDFSELADDDQIQSFREVAYPVSHSFVKFLIRRSGLKNVKEIYPRKDTDRSIAEITGKSKDWWIRAWLKYLNVKPSMR